MYIHVCLTNLLLVRLFFPLFLVAPMIDDLTTSGNSITCDTMGSIPTTVTWERDGSAIVTEGSMTYSVTPTLVNRATSEYSFELTINPIGSVDGEYLCIVANQLGSDTSNITYSVP